MWSEKNKKEASYLSQKLFGIRKMRPHLVPTKRIEGGWGNAQTFSAIKPTHNTQEASTYRG